MRMSIEEIIAKETEIAQEFQKVIDTQMVSETMSLEEMYCGDTEVIEEHLQRCKVFADYHNQIADTMSKYQKIKEIMDELNGDFYGSYLKDRQSLEKIYEVLEDGSENNNYAPNC